MAICRAVVRCGNKARDEERPVSAERRRRDAAVVADKPNLSSGRRVPDTGGPVQARRRDHRPIAREGDTRDRSAVA